jgi:hypothetical protein
MATMKSEKMMAMALMLSCAGQALAAVDARAPELPSMEEVKERLTKRIIDLDKRLDEEYETYWGVTATPVTYKRPPADAVKALASSIGIFIDKYQCLTGKQVGIGEHFTFTLDLNAMTGRDESTG